MGSSHEGPTPTVDSQAPIGVHRCHANVPSQGVGFDIVVRGRRPLSDGWRGTPPPL